MHTHNARHPRFIVSPICFSLTFLRPFIPFSRALKCVNLCSTSDQMTYTLSTDAETLSTDAEMSHWWRCRRWERRDVLLEISEQELKLCLLLSSSFALRLLTRLLTCHACRLVRLHHDELRYDGLPPGLNGLHGMCAGMHAAGCARHRMHAGMHAGMHAVCGW